MADEGSRKTTEQMTLPVVGENGSKKTLHDGAAGNNTPRSDGKPTSSRPANVDAFTDKYEFQDDVRGPIRLNRVERDLVDTPEFQRLFRLGQLGFVDLVYPTANHTRGVHSIGACHWAKKLADTLNANADQRDLGAPHISRAERALIAYSGACE